MQAAIEFEEKVAAHSLSSSLYAIRKQLDVRNYLISAANYLRHNCSKYLNLVNDIFSVETNDKNSLGSRE